MIRRRVRVAESAEGGVGEWRCGGSCGEVWESGDVAESAERCGRVEMWRKERRGVGGWRCGGSGGEMWVSGGVVERGDGWASAEQRRRGWAPGGRSEERREGAGRGVG